MKNLKKERFLMDYTVAVVEVSVIVPLTYQSVIAAFLYLAAACLNVDFDCLTSGGFDCCQSYGHYHHCQNSYQSYPPPIFDGAI